MIRPYHINDSEQVINIWLTASIIAHDFIPASYWKSKVADMRDIYIPSSNTQVYEENGEVLGFISLLENYLAAIFVLPTAQGKGIGKHLIAWAKENCPSLQLSVYVDNANSVAFYKKQGFVIIETRIDEATNKEEFVMQYN